MPAVAKFSNPSTCGFRVSRYSAMPVHQQNSTDTELYGMFTVVVDQRDFITVERIAIDG
jgi:hypothetical protein